jgi:hypothetical protein
LHVPKCICLLCSIYTGSFGLDCRLKNSKLITIP